MNRNFLVIVLLFLSQFALGQMQLQLTAQMPDCKNESFLLLKGDEGGVFVIDQRSVSENGVLSFAWEGDYGFYRLQGDIGKIDFFLQAKDFQFSLDGKPGEGELRFPDQDENNQFHYYLSEFQVLNESIKAIRADVSKLNEKDSLYKELSSQFKRLQKDKKLMLRDLWNGQIDSWAARMALAQQVLIPDIKLKGKQYDEYYRKHFFDYFAFTDTVLQATPIYYEKIGQYLKASKLEALLKAENYKQIKEAIGTLFWMTELEPNSQKYLANYLMNRYPEEQYPKLYHMTVDAYKVLNACEYVLSNKTIQNRILKSKEIGTDWSVPDLDLFNSMDGKIQSISDVNSELTLLVIWSGSCEHSRVLLDRIRNLYPEYNELGLEVVAISLDNNLNYWQQIVAQNQYPWINACDTEGLSGTTATQFSIYVTPTMLLFNPSLKTIAVPQTYFQLEQELMEYFK